MRIIKRKNYYYLQHSFRKGKKVITKEKYLGKEIPKNAEEIKKKLLEECNKFSLFKLFEKIKKEFQKEWKKYPKSIKEKIKQQTDIDFSYNTNAIEGSTITLQETRELVERQISPNKPIKDIKEMESHSKLFFEILEEKDDKLSNELILKWHKRLFQETKPDIAGKFREYLIRVGGYLAPDWQDVKNLMKELVHFYKNNKKINPVELSARMHYKFEKIHPFGDGNGRIGRLIMNYILWNNNYPILVIEYKKRKSYYKALQKDEDKFFSYFSRRYLKMHNRYVGR